MKKFLDSFEEYLLAGSLMFSVGLIGLQVVMRYIFQNSLSWTEEMARYLFIWQTWLGASYAARMGRHIRIETIFDFIHGERNKKMFNLVVHLVWLGFCIFLTYLTSVMAGMLYQSGQSTAALGILIVIPYAAVPVGCGLMAMRLMGHIYDMALDLTGKGGRS